MKQQWWEHSGVDALIVAVLCLAAGLAGVTLVLVRTGAILL